MARNRPPDDPEEYKRFLETAKEVEADESEESFNRAFKRVVPHQKPGHQKPGHQKRR